MADWITDRVLVLGGGLAGVACALELGDNGIEVTLFDRNDHLVHSIQLDAINRRIERHTLRLIARRYPHPVTESAPRARLSRPTPE
jgi:2-polyprenyl-6-methoxyphenol hydroxylase-like FAD-dependent oxidoreductase